MGGVGRAAGQPGKEVPPESSSVAQHNCKCHHFPAQHSKDKTSPELQEESV